MSDSKRNRVDIFLISAMISIMNDTLPSDYPTQPPSRVKIKFNLICASKCKRYTLEMTKLYRPANRFSRISEEFLISCESALKNHIKSRVKSHPSKGKTLM